MSKNRNLFINRWDLTIPTKTGRKEKRAMPPKIKGKHFTNMEFLINAKLVWLTPNIFPCPKFNPDSNNCYFEQCFRPYKKLGEGSFGSVIQVKSLEDNKNYAMKVAKEPFKNECDRKFKIREVKNHHFLSQHPNIVTLHKAWEEDRFLYMQLELCKPSFEDGKALSEQECWKVLADIAQALRCIHESGRGHFDVKAENILLGQDELYKLTDFGLMLNLQDDTEAVKEGDAKYLAPELIMGNINQFTPKADIFSLGMTILELAGNFDLPSGGDAWTSLRKDSFPIEQTKHLSDELFELLTSMLSSDLRKRPSANEILAHPKVKDMVKEMEAIEQCSSLVSDTTTDEQSSTSSPICETTNEPSYKTVCLSRSEVWSTSYSLGNDDELIEMPHLVASTPIYSCIRENQDSYDKNDNKVEKVKRERSKSSNSEGIEMEDIEVEEAEVTFPTPPPSDIHCDWVGLQSPVRAIREASVNKSGLHCPAESLLRFGISPIRLSKECKRDYQEKKRAKIMTPRNLAKSFNDEGEDA